MNRLHTLPLTPDGFYGVPWPKCQLLDTESIMFSYLHHCPRAHMPQYPVKPPRVLPPGPLLRHLPCLPWAEQQLMATQMVYWCLFGSPYFPYLLPHFLSQHRAMSCRPLLLVSLGNHQVKPLKTAQRSVPMAPGPGSFLKTIRMARNSAHWLLCPGPGSNHSSSVSKRTATVPPGLREGAYLLGMDRENLLHRSSIP